MSQSKIEVDVFELPREMKMNYLNRRIEELNNFKKMSDSEKVIFAQLIGHKIAGSAQSYGFVELEPIAKEMERLKANEFEKCRRLISSFEEYVQKVLH